MGPLVTAILLSYKRKPNMPLIVESIRGQTVPTEIWVINNDGCDDFGADKSIHIPWNAGEMARYIWAMRPGTDYVTFQDDDWLIQDERFYEDGIELVEKRPDYLVGTAGRNIAFEGDAYRHEAKKDSGAAILKGHFQIFRRTIARRAHICGHWAASDIYWALDLSQGAPAHYVSGNLSRRLRLVERHGVGLEFRPEHYTERAGVVREWIAHTNVKPYWWSGGEKKYGLYPEEF